MVHHSLATGSRSCNRSDRAPAGAPVSCMLTSRCTQASKSPCAAVSQARGVVKLSPGASVLRQWPKSESAKPPESETLLPRPNSSICQDPAHAS